MHSGLDVKARNFFEDTLKLCAYFLMAKDQEEVRHISPKEFRWLLEGLMIDQPKAVKVISPKTVL